jgi:hypothetical protein
MRFRQQLPFDFFVQRSIQGKVILLKIEVKHVELEVVLRHSFPHESEKSPIFSVPHLDEERQVQEHRL